MISLRTILLTGLLGGSLMQTTSVHAQSAYPVRIDNLLAQLPIPRRSQDCYDACGKETDARTGLVSIKDRGAAYKSLEAQINKIMQASVNAAMNRGVPSRTAPPPPGAGDMGWIKLLSEAQATCVKISQLSSELNAKLLSLDKGPIDNIKGGPDCPLTRQGAIDCGCAIPHATAYETKRVAARDAYLAQVDGLFADYLGRIRPLVQSVDDVIAKTKYGEAISNPTYKQQVLNIQRQAFAPVTSLMGVAGSNWEDAAGQYAGLANARSGVTSGCYGRK